MTDILAHYVKLAQTPGWIAHCWRRVQELDADTSGLWPGIAQAWLDATGLAVVQDSGGRKLTKIR